MYNSKYVNEQHTTWQHRHALLQERLLQANADIVCLQETAADTFDQDFQFLIKAGYDFVLHKKFRFRCATFFKRQKFVLYQPQQVAHKDRTLVTTLQTVTENHNNNNNNSNNNNHDNESRLVHVVNCHLSGGAVPERRLRQLHDAMEQIRKWNDKATTELQKQKNANRLNPHNLQKAQQAHDRHRRAAVVVCGDFNSDGNTAVRRFLVHGQVSSNWREPQYPQRTLTSKHLQHAWQLCDAAELAYGSNVCDGDYGQAVLPSTAKCRPATYVVPNLAARLLLPVGNNNHDNSHESATTATRTQFGFHNVATMDMANSTTTTLGGTSNQGVELVQVQTDEDAQGMVERFTPVLQAALDFVFDQYSTNGKMLTETQLENFLIKVNGQAGRGGLWRHAQVTWEQKQSSSNDDQPNVLSRQEWYKLFARELAEGKWWQVVYDLELCGAQNLRQDNHDNNDEASQHYQGWLDYLYFDAQQLTCLGYQEALTESEFWQIYQQGDALPNAWHPSDHLPVAAVFAWRQ